MSLVGHTVGNFQLVNKIGQGGMGAVYLAHHPTIGRQVAIKVMRRREPADDTMAERFFGEARAVNQISHPHIVEIFDCGREGDRLYLTMEYLRGENLADRIARQPLTIAESVHITLQICDALQASHNRGIIHRDLKPENIFLLRRGDDNNFVKVLDFGLARMPSNLKAYKTAIDDIFGTPAYMSPEQCQAAGRADARSDVYALGLVLYEMLTGDLPFNLKTATETMLAQMTTAPKPPSTHNREIPGELDGIVMRALAKKPSLRYQSMDELAAQLRRVSPQPRAQRPQRDTPRGPTRPRLTPDQPTARMLKPAARPQARRTVAFVITAAILAALAGGIAATWLSHRPHAQMAVASTARREVSSPPSAVQKVEQPAHSVLDDAAPPTRAPSRISPSRVRSVSRPKKQVTAPIEPSQLPATQVPATKVSDYNLLTPTF